MISVIEGWYSRACGTHHDFSDRGLIFESFQPSITEIMMGTTSSGIATLYHWNHDGYHKLWNINPLSLKSWWVPQALEYQPSITEIMMGTTSSGISTLYHWNHDGYHKLWNIGSTERYILHMMFLFTYYWNVHKCEYLTHLLYNEIVIYKVSEGTEFVFQTYQ
jgi:hypothetical protein